MIVWPCDFPQVSCHEADSRRNCIPNVDFRQTLGSRTVLHDCRACRKLGLRICKTVMSQGRPCVSRANFIGSRTVLAAAVQQSTRSLHSDRVAVLWHSRAEYMSVSSCDSRTNTFRVLQKPFNSHACHAAVDRTRIARKMNMRKFSFCP